MADPFIGHELGGYRITRLLKRTGMSMIYLAWDAKLQRDVVVKIMLPAHGGDASFAARFQQEALATARLAHPNIVVIYDFGQRDDLSYMVMEYLPGGSLHDRLVAAAREGKRLDPAQSAAIATVAPLTATPMPTATRVTPTATRRLALPSPTAAAAQGALPAPALLSPAEDTTMTGQATFTWRWDGPALAANQAFELRIWKDGQPDHYGVAEPTRDTSITINVNGAYGVMQGGPGSYYWTVAVVTRDPYQRIGPEAPPRRLQIGGGDGGWTSPQPTPTLAPP